MVKRPTVWMIRPYIFDFTAYDQFAQPVGFLRLASFLIHAGIDVCYFDCLSRNSEKNPRKLRCEANGCGEYFSQEIPKPDIFSDVPRIYKRYGVPEEIFQKFQSSHSTPDLVLITTGMSYWYEGIDAVVRSIRINFPDIPIAIGGIYSTLVPEHARTKLDVQFVEVGPASSDFFEWADAILGAGLKEAFHRSEWESTQPAWRLIDNLQYGIVYTSQGCNLRCRYCGCARLTPFFTLKSIPEIEAELQRLKHPYGICNVAIGDDDLGRLNTEHFREALRRISSLPFRFHFYLPNAMNAEVIDEGTVELMKRVGFEQPRLSLPLMDIRLTSEGLNADSLRTLEFAAKTLLHGGFQEGNISIYLIAGLPGQQLRSLKNASLQLLSIGILPYLAQYSPVPGTICGDQRLKKLGYIDNPDPLLTNKLLSVFRHDGWSGSEFMEFSSELTQIRMDHKKNARINADAL